MKLKKDDFYDLVSDLLTRAEFDQKISKNSERYSGLINEDVLAHLVVDELGRNVSNLKRISELKPNSKVSLFATVTPPEPKIFSKKKGNISGAEIYLFDSIHRCRLILWDAHHVELIEKGEIEIGTRLKLLNAKITSSSFGLDLTLDRYESLIINPLDFPEPEDIDPELSLSDLAVITEDGPVNVLGTIAWKSQLRTFNRKDKSKGYVLNLDLYDGTGKIRITLWDDHAKAAEEYNIGEQLKIINGNSKMHNSVREIHSSYRSQIIREAENNDIVK